MKLFKFLTVLLSSAIALPAMALELIPEQNEKGKWGYINEMGTKVIDYKYDEANYFNNGLALVRKGNALGMIDSEGKEIIPVKYDIIEPHSNDIFRVAANGKHKDGVLLDETYGFITADGKVLLKPEYDEIGIFKDGIAYIKKGQLYGFINDKIDIVIPCKYNAIGSFNENGLVWVAEGVKYDKQSTTKFTGGKFGIFNKEGEAVIEPKYKHVGCYVPYVYSPKQEYLDKLHINHRTTLLESGSHTLLSPKHAPYVNFEQLPTEFEGYYASNNDAAKKNAIFDRNGNLLIKEGKYDFVFYPTDGFALVMDKKNKYNYLNMSTNKLMFKKYIDAAWAFDNGVAVVSREGKGWELINTDGESISSTYKYIFPKKDGVYVVQSDASKDYILYGAINSKGREIIPANHTYVYPPSNGLLACRSNDDKTGYRNTSGEWAIQPTFLSNRSFIDGMASVKTNDGWGLIDTTGKQVVKCRWKDTITKDCTKSGFMWVTDEAADRPGFILLDVATDNIVSPDKYQWIRTFGSDFDNVAIVGKDSSHVGIITKDGKMIIPAIFEPDQARMAYRSLSATPGKVWEEFDSYLIKLYTNPNRNRGSLSSKLEPTLWDY